MLALNSASLTGITTATVFGRKSATVESTSHVNVRAGEESKKNGSIGMEAGKINIGLGHKTDETSHTQKVQIGTISAENRIVVDELSGVSLEAKKEVAIAVGNWFVMVKEDKVTIGKFGGAPQITIGPDNVEIAGKQIRAKDEGGGQIRVENGQLKLTGTAARIL